MAAQKRPAEDADGGGGSRVPQPYVRVSNRQRLAQQKQSEKATTATTTARPPPPVPTQQQAADGKESGGDLAAFYRAWQWKREHLPDRLRFHQPYRYEWDDDGDGGNGGGNGGGGTAAPPPKRPPLTITQRPFGPEGFASTVWDSSIVVAKMIEHHAADFKGLRCCDLSAGCGLPAAVLAAGTQCAAVVAADLPANLPLLRQNVERAAAASASAARSRKGSPAAPAVAVVPHTWGDDVSPVLRAGGIVNADPAPGRAFDLVLLCDGMYVGDPPSAVDALAASVARLVDRGSGRAIVAHGRNRLAEPAFLKAVRGLGMVVEEVDRAELHPRYVCNDVSVYCLRHGGGRGGGGGTGGGRRGGERGGGGGDKAASGGAGARGL